MTAAAKLATACGPRIDFTGIDLTLGRTRILEQVSFSVAAGSVHAIVGPNGGGKSSLIDQDPARADATPGPADLALAW